MQRKMQAWEQILWVRSSIVGDEDVNYTRQFQFNVQNTQN